MAREKVEVTELMAKTLETIATLAATPIPNNSAPAISFANDYAKLGVPNISTRDRKTILVLALIHSLSGTGGINYVNNHKGLFQDATVFTKGISMIDFWTAFAATAWSSARANDATLTSDIEALFVEGKDLVNLHEDQLDRIIIYLLLNNGF